jgi:HD-GYP domain-containing protein (c-di-GMP phosphodiesterase class II)
MMRLRGYSLPFYVAALFLTVLMAYAAISITLEYRSTRQMMLAAAGTLFDRVGAQVHAAVEASYNPAILTADILSNSVLAEDRTLEDRLRHLPMMVGVLRDQPELEAVYVGYDDGDFFLVRRLPHQQATGKAGAAYLVQSVAHAASGARQGRYIYFDADLTLLFYEPMPDYAFDPRTRPWYREASAKSAVQVVEPYVFFTTREVGATVAQRSPDGHAVAGVDITLSTLSSLLSRIRPVAGAQLMIYKRDGDVVADADASSVTTDAAGMPRLVKASELGSSILARLAALPPASTPRGLVIADDAGKDWQGFIAPLEGPGMHLWLAIAAPNRGLLADVASIRNTSMTVALLLLFATIPAVFGMSRLVSRPLRALTAEARAVQTLRFDETGETRSHILEIDALAQAMSRMKATIRQFLSIGAVLAGERSFDTLLERVLEETTRIAGAIGGIVYLMEPDGRLRPVQARWRDVANPPLPPEVQTEEEPNHPVARAVREGNQTIVMTAEELQRWYPALTYDRPLVTQCIVLKNRQGEVSGVLVLRQEEGAHGDAAQAAEMAFIEAISGTAAAVIDTQRLIDEQKRMLEAFIQIIAGAIDSKSPYTGGHCQRVPELTKMLAHAAENSRSGPFADFALSAAQWEELHIAAWLHDCGKVTTPEYVIDKATKLETIHDRLHEVRMRFEVAKREAEGACWRAIADGADRAAELAALDALWRDLDADFAFVAACNQGGEFMGTDQLGRLYRIAERRWTRTLDDRIGLSYEEAQRKSVLPPVPVPASEPLLADRPDHVIPRNERDRVAPDNPWGFKITAPEHLYNRGELHNLAVARGTLTHEERYRINAHMIETIRMLSGLPLPRHLSQVVEIAGGHHEKMDGTGYPRQLTRNEMSWPARMVAVADIFEALTAVDRPYKPGKTLSQSLAIMARMCDENHIDPDVFRLFVETGVYRDYAERFLRPEQIDEVVVERILAPAA